MITIRPSSGLCNRLRAIASGVRLAKECGCALNIDWYYCPIRRWAPLLGVSVPFSRFFHVPEEFSVSNHMRIKYEMPWDKKIYILADADIYSEKHSSQFVDQCLHGSGNEEKRFWTCYNFYPSKDYSWLRPRREILDEVDETLHRFGRSTIGVHIRRTDHASAIRHSPLEGFIAKVDAEIERDSSVTIFLATDSDETKTELCKRYHDRLITRRNVAPRYTLKGERDGLIDMLLLSKTCRIYGSFKSSYSEVAAHIGKINLFT